MHMDWWLWLAGGLALVVAEVVTPSGFFILFFGIGALAVGILTWIGVVDSLAAQILSFTVLSVASLLIFRERLQRSVPTPASVNVDSLVGVVAIVQETLSPGVIGRVEVRGSMWSARNSSDVLLAAGQRARVAAVDGLTLNVIPE
jgi:membrane protein implicated in regulation of membrane protease activity